MRYKYLVLFFFTSVISSLSFAVTAFDGFYVGGSAGGSFLTAQENISSQVIVDFPIDTLGNRIRTTVPTNVEGSLRDSSGIGALFAGYGLGINRFYIGAEAFISFANYKLHNSGNSSTEQFLAINVQSYSATNNWQVETEISQCQYGLDARPGVFLNQDMLLYARAGFARPRITQTSDLQSTVVYLVSRSESNNLTPVTSSTALYKTALRLGGGFEYHLTPKYSIRMDYTHVDYGKISSIGEVDKGITSSVGLLGYRLNNGNLFINNSTTVRSISTNAISVGLSYYFS